MFVGVDGLDFAEVDRFIVDDLLLCALLKLVDDSGGWTSITTSGWRPSSSSAVDVESCLAVGLGTVSSTRFNDRQTKKNKCSSFVCSAAVTDKVEDRQMSSLQCKSNDRQTM